MKKTILPGVLFLTITLLVGTLTAFAFPSQKADVVSSATGKTTTQTAAPSKPASSTAAPAKSAAQTASKSVSAQLTAQEQQRLSELLRQEQLQDQQEDALEQSYRSGAITRADYLKQKAALEAAEDAVEWEKDALELKAGYDDDYDDDHDHDDDHDDDRDDYDDHDDDRHDHD